MRELEQVYEHLFGEALLRVIVPSATTENMEYEVVFTKGGMVTCDCPGWMYRKGCRHTELAWKELTGFQRAMFEARKNDTN